jgi:hypothetical protein
VVVSVSVAMGSRETSRRQRGNSVGELHSIDSSLLTRQVLVASNPYCAIAAICPSCYVSSLYQIASLKRDAYHLIA